MSAALLLGLVGAALLGVGIALAALGPVRPGLALQSAGSAVLGIAGVIVLADGHAVGAAFHGAPRLALGIDPLSGAFLAIVGLTAAPALAYAGPYLTDHGGHAGSRAVAALTGTFVLALAGVLVARDPVTLLAFWELMTMAPAAAILVARRDRESLSAVRSYVAITHLGSVGVWISVLLLAHLGALTDAGHAAPVSAADAALVAAAALVGFGTKAGLVPLHVWLPRAHPVAPAPLSAVMSGAMTKVALYGMIRVLFTWLPTPGRGVALTLLGLGVASALGGVVWALAQRDLKRLLAYSTIENVGIVALGLSAALLFARDGHPEWAAIAFAAAILHAANHAVFKTLLFLGAGAIEHATGSRDLDRLGGLLARMPVAGGALLVGAWAIAGLPPLNGFASEWLTLQSLLHLPLAGSLGDGIAGAIALAALATTAALACLAFAKVVGLALLARPRTDRAAAATDPPAAMRGALLTLAAGCVALGALPGLIVPTLVRLHATATRGAHLSIRPPAAVSIHVPGTGSFPALALLLGLAAATALIAGARARAGGRRRAPAAAPTWACGQPLHPALNWTSDGYTKGLRLVLASVLRPRRDVEIARHGPIVTEITYTSATPSLLDGALYGPASRTATRAAELARRMQTGSVRTYAAYLAALVAILLVLVGSGALG